MDNDGAADPAGLAAGDVLALVLAHVLPSGPDTSACCLVSRRWRQAIGGDALAGPWAELALSLVSAEAAPGAAAADALRALRDDPAACAGSWRRLCRALAALRVNDEERVPLESIVVENSRIGRVYCVPSSGMEVDAFTTLVLRHVAIAEGSGVWMVAMRVRRRSFAMAVGTVDAALWRSGPAAHVRDGSDPEYIVGWTGYYQGGHSFNFISAIGGDALAGPWAELALSLVSAEAAPGAAAADALRALRDDPAACAGSWRRLCRALAALRVNDEERVPLESIVVENSRIGRVYCVPSSGMEVDAFTTLVLRHVAIAEGSGVWMVAMRVRRRSFAMAVGTVDAALWRSGPAAHVRDGSDPEYIVGWTGYYQGGHSFNFISNGERVMRGLCGELAFEDVAVVLDMAAAGGPRAVAFVDGAEVRPVTAHAPLEREVYAALWLEKTGDAVTVLPPQRLPGGAFSAGGVSYCYSSGRGLRAKRPRTRLSSLLQALSRHRH
eukprot:m51a1_g5898 hypothetical protein (495) ;mRNA; f:549784-552005